MGLLDFTRLVGLGSLSGPTLADSDVKTSLMPAAATFSFDPGEIILGKALRIRASGSISNIVTTPGTLNLYLTLSAKSGGDAHPFSTNLVDVDIFDSGAMPLCIVAKTDTHWMLEVDLVCRAIDENGVASFFGQGRWISHSAIGSPVATVGSPGSVMLPFNTVAVDGATFDSLTWQNLSLQGEWSIADAGNSITMHAFTVQALN